MRARRLSPRVKLHKNGTVTISGVSIRDMRSILTEAELRQYDAADEAKERYDQDLEKYQGNETMLYLIERNRKEALIWFRRIKWITKTLQNQIDERIRETHGIYKDAPQTIAQRWIEVRDKIKVKEIVQKMLAERRA